MKWKILGMILALLTGLPVMAAANDDCSNSSGRKFLNRGTAHVIISIKNNTSDLLVSTLSRDIYSYASESWAGKAQINTINTSAGETAQKKSRFPKENVNIVYYVDIPGFGESSLSFFAKSSEVSFDSATLANGITCDRRWSNSNLQWIIKLTTANAPTQ